MNDLQLFLQDEAPHLTVARAMELLHRHGILTGANASAVEPGEVTGSEAVTAAMWLRHRAGKADQSQGNLL